MLFRHVTNYPFEQLPRELNISSTSLKKWNQGYPWTLTAKTTFLIGEYFHRAYLCVLCRWDFTRICPRL